MLTTRQKLCMLTPTLIVAGALLSVWAGDVTVQFDIQPRALRVGEGAVCSIAVRGMENPPQPNLPPIDGFQIGFAGVERSFSFGTGSSDRSVTFRFRLVPLRAGRFEIGPFVYRINNQDVPLPPITLTVVAPGESAQGEQRDGQEDLLFAELTISPTNLFSQQIFDLVFNLYAADGINLGRDLSVLNLPNVGLSIQQLQDIGSDRVARNNRIYIVRRFAAKATALSAGQFELAPVLRTQVLVQRERRRARDPFWGDFDPFESFFGRVEAQTVDVPVMPVTLSIRPLPDDGRPASFGGAVGRFDFKAEMKPLAGAVGDPVTINLTIMGEGNIENVNAPALVAPESWRVYDSKLVTKEINAQRAVGRKVFEVVAIPGQEGRIEWPVIEFSYFDPEQQGYRTIRQGPFVFNIRPATNVPGKVVGASTPDRTISAKVVGTDIVDLKRELIRPPINVNRKPETTPIWEGIQSIPILAVLISVIARRRKILLQENVAYARRTRAPRAARAGLRRVAEALERSDRAAFFEALYSTLADYFGNRLNLPPGAVLSSEVLARLQTGGLPREYLQTLEELYRKCEEERYAGRTAERTASSVSTEWRDWIQKLEDILQACERIKL